MRHRDKVMLHIVVKTSKTFDMRSLRARAYEATREEIRVVVILEKFMEAACVTRIIIEADQGFTRLMPSGKRPVASDRRRSSPSC